MSRFAFFRQSTWLLLATAGGGLFGVLLQKLAGHFIPAANHLNPSETYSSFISMREAQAQLCIPFIGMQTAFAQLAARSGALQDDEEVSGALRGLLKCMLGFWVIMGVLCQIFQNSLMATYKLTGPWILWLTLGLAMVSAATPALFGVLQGKQRFLELGAARVASDVSLVIGVGLVLVLLVAPANRGATAGLAGLLLGALLAFGIALHLTRSEWKSKPKPFDFMGFLKRCIPLTLGLGVTTFMFSEDMLTVQKYLLEGADGYTKARVVGRTVIFITAPLVWVMFPKVVSSVAQSETTSVMAQALGATALIGGGASIACSLFPELPLRLLFGSAYLSYAPMVPWFAWSLLPLVLANVLISNLLARERFAIIPASLLIAAAYGLTLRFHHPSHQAIVVTLACFSSLLLLVSWIYTVRESKRASVK
ncbi:MAG: hypothetical protein JNN07_18400 [Verrucomicrobiales bacterium]|nr:hypothetical protein [Verrucomicrobiales bacterium]